MDTPHGRRDDFNPWKWTTLAIVGLIVAGLTATLVVANYRDEADEPLAEEKVAAPRAAEPQAAPEKVVSSRPPAAVIEDCNAYAAGVRNRTEEALKGAVIGGAVGAGVGAAGGAIAKGGKGAGKGAGIGSILGATVGTLYGLDQANQANARAQEAYRACMARRGYSG
jgi:hypothetical protein